jgi:hypothetical protein
VHDGRHERGDPEAGEREAREHRADRRREQREAHADRGDAATDPCHAPLAEAVDDPVAHHPPRGLGHLHRDEAQAGDGRRGRAPRRAGVLHERLAGREHPQDGEQERRAPRDAAGPGTGIARAPSKSTA